MKGLGRRPPSGLVVISVNASTDPEPEMDKSNKQPSLEETIDAVSSAQLHRYNAATLELMEETLPRWAKELSTPERTVESHFIQVGFNDIDKPDLLKFFNLIPTSFDLSDEQVDKLIEAGRRLIRENPDFQSLLAEQGRASAKRSARPLGAVTGIIPPDSSEQRRMVSQLTATRRASRCA